MKQAAVVARLTLFEGSVSHMYRCTGGKVTIGVGHAIETSANAGALDWQVDGGNASPAMVQADYAKVAAAPVGLPAKAYANLTQCRMTDAAIDSLLQSDLRLFEAQLAAALPKWNAYPELAQQALFDMAYNLGIGGLLKFHQLLNSVDSGDWGAAEQQCHRRGIQPPRNDATAALFRAAGQAS